MKAKVAAVVAMLVACATVGTAVATPSAQSGYTIYNRSGIWCKGGQSSGGITCIPTKGYGYAIAFNRTLVMVRKYDSLSDDNGHGVYLRFQP